MTTLIISNKEMKDIIVKSLEESCLLAECVSDSMKMKKRTKMRISERIIKYNVP